MAFHRTPCLTMPKLMMQESAELTTERLNCFPVKHSMSKHHGLRVIMNQEPVDHNKHCKHEFGGHVHAHHQHDPTQSMIERTIDAVCLQPNLNQQGGHRVVNLHTGKPIA